MRSPEFKEPITPEVEKIQKAPKTERRERLETFKEQLAEKEHAALKIQNELLKIVEKNPDAGEEELQTRFATMAELASFTKEEKELGEGIITAYQTRHEAVRAAREKYSDDAQLFEAAFGRPPKGAVEIIEEPMTLYFRCFNPNDYAYIYNQEFARKTPPTEEEKAKAMMSGGVHIHTAHIPSLRGAIIAERSRPGTKPDKRILTHERQHAYKNLFYEQYFDKVKRGSTAELTHVSPKDEPEKFSVLYERLLRGMRMQMADHQLKDELLAYFKNGESEENIKKFLLTPEEKGGLYDYLHYVREQHLDFGPEVSPRTRELIEKTVQKVFGTEYEELIEDALGVVESLEVVGYSKDETVAFLITKPLSQWKKAAQRLIRQRHEA